MEPSFTDAIEKLVRISSRVMSQVEELRTITQGPALSLGKLELDLKVQDNDLKKLAKLDSKAYIREDTQFNEALEFTIQLWEFNLAEIALEVKCVGSGATNISSKLDEDVLTTLGRRDEDGIHIRRNLLNKLTSCLLLESTGEQDTALRQNQESIAIVRGLMRNIHSSLASAEQEEHPLEKALLELYAGQDITFCSLTEDHSVTLNFPPESTYGELTKRLNKTANTKNLSVLEYVCGPRPRWRYPMLQKSVPKELRRFYYVDKRPGLFIVVVRTLDTDRPVAIRLPVFETPPTFEQVLEPVLEEGSFPALITTTSGHSDMRNSIFTYQEKDPDFPTVAFVDTTNDKTPFQFRTSTTKYVPPLFQATLVGSMRLVKRASTLKVLKLGASHICRAILHLVISLIEGDSGVGEHLGRAEHHSNSSQPTRIHPGLRLHDSSDFDELPREGWGDTTPIRERLREEVQRPNRLSTSSQPLDSITGLLRGCTLQLYQAPVQTDSQDPFQLPHAMSAHQVLSSSNQKLYEACRGNDDSMKPQILNGFIQLQKKTSELAIRDGRNSDLYRCNVEGCRQMPQRRWDLASHLLKHIGDFKPWVCVPQCGKAYARNGDLKRHKRACKLVPPVAHLIPPAGARSSGYPNVATEVPQWSNYSPQFPPSQTNLFHYMESPQVTNLFLLPSISGSSRSRPLITPTMTAQRTRPPDNQSYGNKKSPIIDPLAPRSVRGMITHVPTRRLHPSAVTLIHESPYGDDIGGSFGYDPSYQWKIKFDRHIELLSLTISKLSLMSSIEDLRRTQELCSTMFNDICDERPGVVAVRRSCETFRQLMQRDWESVKTQHLSITVNTSDAGGSNSQGGLVDSSGEEQNEGPNILKVNDEGVQHLKPGNAIPLLQHVNSVEDTPDVGQQVPVKVPMYQPHRHETTTSLPTDPNTVNSESRSNPAVRHRTDQAASNVKEYESKSFFVDMEQTHLPYGMQSNVFQPIRSLKQKDKAKGGRSAGKRSTSLDLSDDSVPKEQGVKEQFILVMGSTGTGKSSFINAVSQSTFEVGRGLQSPISEVHFSKPFELFGHRVVLIDTPGFDNTNRTEVEILADIGLFLGRFPEQRHRLIGVIYLHDISNSRVGTAAIRNVEIFKKAVGEMAAANVVIVTTKWDLVEPSTGDQRHRQISEDLQFFGEILNGGAIVQKLTGEQSQLGIVKHIVQRHKNVSLQVKTELVDETRNIGQTLSGVMLRAENDPPRPTKRRKIKHTGNKEGDEKNMQLSGVQSDPMDSSNSIA